MSLNITKARRLLKEARYAKATEILLPTLIDTHFLKENKKIKQEVAEVFIAALKHQETIIFLKNLLSKTSGQASAFVYLASFVRDNGSLSEAIKLYKIALFYDEKNIEIAVMLLSALEAYGNKDKALEVAKAILKKFSDMKIAEVSMQKILDIISVNEKKFVKINCSASNTTATPCPYSHNELSIIDLCFHIVKLLFSIGNLEQTSKIVEALQPIRQRGGDLHLTIIRNSNSYFSFIEKLLESTNYTSCKQNDLPKIYVLGDSHSLSLAWQTLNLQGQDHIIYPLLATGCKIWHLRSDGNFFPKENFWNLAKTIVTNSKVIIILGEIDLREGILFAVQNGIYNSINEAMEKLIEIYFSALKKLLANQNLQTIYIHPVPPVLNETRFMIRPFDQMLKNFFTNLPEEYRDKIIWLDIAENFLDENFNLKEIYKLDGTHLHPSYCYSLLQNSL